MESAAVVSGKYRRPYSAFLGTVKLLVRLRLTFASELSKYPRILILTTAPLNMSETFADEALAHPSSPEGQLGVAQPGTSTDAGRT